MFVVIFLSANYGKYLLPEVSSSEIYSYNGPLMQLASCADPLLSSVTDGGVNSIGFNEVDLKKPYRYIPLVASGYMDEIGEDAKEGLETDVNNLHDGFFLGIRIQPVFLPRQIQI